MGWLVFSVVRDWSGDPAEGPGGLSSRSGMDWGSLMKVRDGSGCPLEGPGRVGRLFQRSRTCWGNLLEVRDGLGDTPGGTHVGHVLCKQYGFAAADFLPLHFSFFLQQVLLDRNTTNTKVKNRNLSLRRCVFGVRDTFRHGETIATNRDVKTA